MRWSRANDRFSLAGDFRHAHPSKSGDSPGIRAGVLPPVCGLRVGGFYTMILDTECDLRDELASRLPQATELFGQDAISEWVLAHNNELDDNRPIKLPQVSTH